MTGRFQRPDPLGVRSIIKYKGNATVKLLLPQHHVIKEMRGK